MKSLCKQVLCHVSKIKNKDLQDKSVQMQNNFFKYYDAFKNDPEVQIIEKSFKNILNSPVPSRASNNMPLYIKSVLDTFTAISIFCNIMNQLKSKQLLEIERKLFRISFIPGDNYLTCILPVFLHQFEFLTTKQSYVNLSSSTGSGKTRVAPFILSIMSYLNKLEQPFIIMTQPSTTFVNDKIQDYEEILGNSVMLISNQDEFESLYKKKLTKPVVAIFTPRTLIKVIVNAQKMKYPLIKMARFALDEVHERSINIDVLIAILSKEMGECSIPLHLLMMTATPDDRLFKSFKENILNIILPNTELFPIRVIPKSVDKFNEIDGTAKDSTMDIIKDMATGIFEPGHILIFTSGNRRINNLMNSITEEITKYSQTNQKVQLLKKCDTYMNCKELFYDHIDEVLLFDENSDNKLYFIVMKYAGFLSNEEKTIAKDPISDHPNVIKIIISTNSIESSITIESLAAVVDSGICNMAKFDKNIGITTIEESPISVQSQTQRKGRVGRIRDGICVQITIDKFPPTKYTDPAIVTHDISSNILDFKKIGIDLEKIDNLPSPGIKKESMMKYIEELVKYQAIDSRNKLTETGNELASFPSLSPFLSSSILTVAKKYKDSKNAKIIGALIFLLTSSRNLVSDTTSDCFRKNFCEDSDIITLLFSIIEVKTMKGKIQANLEKSGFNITNTLRMIGTIEQIISIIYDDNDNSENKNQLIWSNLQNFCKLNDMMKFIKYLFMVVKNNRPDWIEYRKAEYFSIVNALVDPNYIYKLINSNDQIRIRKRPGGKGLAAPGSCFILQIERQNDNSLHGSIFHRDFSREETCHPQIFVTSNFMNNVFTVPLIEGYIGGKKTNFKQFLKVYNYSESTYFNTILCCNEQYGDKTIISYVTNDVNDKKSQNLMEDAIKKVEKIIPFTPRTILVRNNILKAIVAVTNVGVNNFISKVILYTDTNPIPYHINEVTINYLIDHLDELNSIDDHLVIAVTGEKFMFSEENNFTGFPNAASGRPWVFMENTNFYSHLVVLSENEIPNAKSISWVDSKIHVTYSDVDALIQASNNVFRGIVQVSHDDDMLYSMNQKAQVIFDQKNHQNRVFKLDFNGNTQRSNVFRPIGCMFDRFAMNTIKRYELIKDVDLKSFRLSIPNKCQFLDKEIMTISLCRKNNHKLDPRQLINEIPKDIVDFDIEEIKQEQNNINEQIGTLKVLRDNLSNQFTTPGSNKGLIKRRQAEVKSQLNDLYGQMNDSKQKMESFKQSIERFCDTHGIDTSCFESLLQLKKSNSQSSIVELNGLSNNYYLEMECSVDDREMIIATIKEITNLNTEVIPLCNIIINHDQSSTLDKIQFDRKIDEICSHFGAVIKYQSEYQNSEKSYQGCKKIIIYTGEFSIPFAGEVRKALGKIDHVQLKIPQKIIPSCLQNRTDVIEIINQWILDNHLTFQRSGYKYYGNSEEVSKALNLLSKKETQPKIPYKSHTVPGGIEIDKIVSALNHKNAKLSTNLRWGISRSTRLIYTPEDIEDESVQEFIQRSFKRTIIRRSKDDDKGNKSNKVIYDYLYMCEDEAALSGSQIPLYQKNGSAEMKNFCINCGYELFKNQVERLFDAEEDMPRLDLLSENTELVKFIPILTEDNNDLWPQVPLGQLLWSLTSEPVMNSVTKTWFSAIVYQALHCSQYLDYCPDHPSILLRVTGKQMKCKCPGCKMFLCEKCKKWHKPGECSEMLTLPPGYRVCPWCNRPVEKTEACNRISCKCGKFFCYYCGFKGNTAKEIYAHLSKEHNGYFVNPPDYKKYYLHEEVSDKELNEFYKKYPHIKCSSSFNY